MPNYAQERKHQQACAQHSLAVAEDFVRDLENRTPLARVKAYLQHVDDYLSPQQLPRIEWPEEESESSFDWPMADVRAEFMLYHQELEAAALEVLRSGRYIGGQEVRLLEEELSAYLKVAHTVTCGNGTDALFLSLKAMDVQPGDEVIVPDFTFCAAAEAVALIGATPVLVDVDLDTYTISIDSLREALSDRTKVIIPVHLFGRCADMASIMQIARERGLLVLEDAAQSFGATYEMADELKCAGTIGDMGITSFFPTKNLSCCGDGGAIFTDNSDLAERVRMLANHGARHRYQHEIVGMNSRLDALQAAMLRVKLRHADSLEGDRLRAAFLYHLALKPLSEAGILFTPKGAPGRHVYHQYTVRFSSPQLRNDAIELLQENRMPYMFYYPSPTSELASMRDVARRIATPNTHLLCELALSLPFYSQISPIHQQAVCDSLAPMLLYC